MAVPFHKLLKSHRMATGLTLRAFCREHGIDPGAQSRMERGMSPAPMGMFFVKKLGDELGLKYGTPDWDEFRDSVAASHGRLPSDLRTNQRLLAKLPVLFGALRSGGCPAEKLDAMIELVRETAEQNETEKESDMAKKKARRVADTTAAEAAGTTEADKYRSRLEGRIAKIGGNKMAFAEWAALFAFILEAIQACQNTNSARIVKRTARPGILLHAIQIIRLRRALGVTRPHAAVLADAIIDEAKADGRAMVRFVDEAKASLAAAGE